MLKKMKIGTKLIITFVLVALISSISGVVSLILLKTSDSQYSQALIYYGFAQGDIGLLMNSFTENISDIMQILAAEDQALVQQAQNDIQNNTALINQYMAAIEPALIGDEEKGYYKTVSNNLPELIEHSKQVIAQAMAGDRRGAMTFYQTECVDHVNSINDAISKLMEVNKTTGTNISDLLTKNTWVTLVSMSIVIVVAVVISILLALYMTRKVARPMGLCSERLVMLSNGDLKTPVPVVNTQDETGVLAGATERLVQRLTSVIEEMSEVLGQMADGNLQVELDRDYDGDFKPLSKSTKKIIRSLNSALGQIATSSDQVASGSDQVSSGAQALSQGATEQASAVEELAATITEISTRIHQNAESAADARDKANEVGKEMTVSNEQMREMIEAMTHISESSNEIGKIIKTIEDIAFQTNILALNAAVEAARAGAAGKGFAVVADEVRNLANKSQEASKNTSALIENSIKAVEQGTRIADGTAQSLLKAVEGTSEVVKTIDLISTASEEQAGAIGQVTQGIDQISAVVQTNSATAEQSAAASEELSGQAQLMKNLVGQFRIKAVDTSNVAAEWSEAEMPRRSVVTEIGASKY